MNLAHSLAYSRSPQTLQLLISIVQVSTACVHNFETRKVPVQKDSEDEGNPPGENEEEKSENEPKPVRITKINEATKKLDL